MSIENRLPGPGKTVRINGEYYLVISPSRNHGDGRHLAGFDGYLHTWTEFIDLYSEERLERIEIVELVEKTQQRDADNQVC